jgi:uncharacterized protein YbaP (TraB family)
MVSLLAAAALATTAPLAPSTPGILAAQSPATAPLAAADRDEPAMFVVRDGDTTIYLFGTFHALDGHLQWFDNDVRTAFEQSDELVLETLIPEGPVIPSQLGHAFRGPSVTASASFLATTKMAISAGRTQGMQVDNGADMVLRHAAEREGKPVEGLETLEFQLNMFNHMPAPPVPSSAAAPDAAPMQSLSKSMAEMQSAWKTGNQAVFVRLLDELRQGAPDTYRMMFTDRNARWADWIAARMQTPGTVFVAVGAGHLAGKDSVLVRLAQKGIESARVY